MQVTRALQRAGRDRLTHASSLLDRLGGALALLNPEAVLERGYAIVTEGSGAVVSDARQLRAGEAVLLTFATGSATATVEATRAPDAD